MVDLFQNKYRIESTRLKDWDYARSGCYYVTICTQGKKCDFGKIIEDKMNLNRIGKIAKQYWLEIPKHFPNTSLDEFVVIPNHIHGIIIINKNGNDYVETPKLGVSTKHWEPHSLAVIINQYKRICTINIHKQFPLFAWQSRYYDRIVRNDEELNRIREYIIFNPLKWSLDQENPEDKKGKNGLTNTIH